MTSSDAGNQNLTGVWNGLYSYPNGDSTSFVATLIQSGGGLTGSTHEPSNLQPGVTLYANIAGSQDGGLVTFIKTYDPPRLPYAYPVHYEGGLNGDASEIEGRWTIGAVASGKFLMTRPTRRAATTSRKALERV